MADMLERLRDYEEDNNSIAKSQVKFDDGITYEEEYDVIIIGGGGTGLAAAVQASQEGLSCLVLEKGEEHGGTTARSGGVLMAADTQPQKELTEYKDDSADLYCEQMILAGEGRVDEDLVYDLTHGGSDNIDWLTDLGVEWESLYGMNQIPYIDDKYYADRIHVYKSGGGAGGGAYLVSILYDHVKDNEYVDIRVQAPAVQLIQDKDSKEVLGVVSLQDGEEIYYKAIRGVLIASASIDHNPALAKKYHPQQFFNIQHSRVLPAETNTGDGIIMGMAAGGAVDFGGTIDFCGKTFNGTNNQNPTIPLIFVDGSGKRFVAEDSTYAYQYRAIWQRRLQLDHPTYMIFTEESAKEGQIWDKESLEEDVEEGLVIKASSIEELAEKTDIDPGVLKNTLEEWNNFASQGEDPAFGRRQGLKPIEGENYYAYQNQAFNLGSLGGLKINTNCQVVDEFEEPIGGLYAAGLASGGWVGDYYPASGYDISAVIHQGRKSIKHIASK